MCPSASIPLAPVINEYWTDGEIIMSLLNFKTGSPLPSNVISDVNPYQHTPSFLPAGLWYFCSGVKQDAECGFWLATGAACEIYSNSAIIGMRTTLRFYEGRTPHERKTDWVMQEYTINEKRNINEQDHRVLCRVFLAGEKKPPGSPCIANINVKISVNLEPMRVSKLLEKTTDNKTGSTLITQGGRFFEKSAKTDCILQGDYIELNDLFDSESFSSISANSSCLTMTSEKYFDPIALLQELDTDVINQEITDSSIKFNLSAPVKSNEVVICPTAFVSLGNDKECAPSAQETSKVDNTTSTSSAEGASMEGRKERVGKTKRGTLMRYLCFLAF